MRNSWNQWLALGQSSVVTFTMFHSLHSFFGTEQDGLQKYISCSPFKCSLRITVFTVFTGFSCLPKDHYSLSENRVTPNSEYHHFPYWSGNLEVYTIFNIPDIPIGFPWMGNRSKWLVYKCLWMFVIFYNGKSQSKHGWFRGTSISGNLHVETAWGPGKAKPAAKDQLQILVRKLTGKSNMAGKSFFKTCEEWWFHVFYLRKIVISWVLNGKSPD